MVSLPVESTYFQTFKLAPEYFYGPVLVCRLSSEVIVHAFVIHVVVSGLTLAVTYL